MQKFGLDNPCGKKGSEEKGREKPEKPFWDGADSQLLSGIKGFEKNIKKGVDFAGQTRYNVCLYGKLEEGGAIHAQH